MEAAIAAAIEVAMISIYSDTLSEADKVESERAVSTLSLTPPEF